ncbi:hypothetical protein HZF05_03560 [Sphingomonas sp. CGMCC 1.13654]|uniref:Uncharacterized protein n=1 Tax=Sphingomonas chungangi TaxID=2683589 RepID=A0A838L284_9SPHN|nr:hypothetical protein [Sphingomonas chungangi]MBA2933167.1 hypothetical protein [Sphingomonas chungangi]MVW57839.1 hypothetical protein [Sphingomonas chungangi]
MEIRKISLGLAAVALLGVSPAMAAAPVMPSVASISLAPVAGTNLGSTVRRGAVKQANGSNIAAGVAVVVAVLAAGAVAGGVAAGTSGGHSSTSP